MLKKPSAFTVTIGNLYNVACKTFKEMTGRRMRCLVYADLYNKYKHEYGFHEFEVQTVLDKAAAWADVNSPCAL
jgi:hypothetical protein